jgi:hypothetical protein
MTWSVQPEPTDEAERRVLLAAVEQALAEAGGESVAYATPWWRAGLDDLGGDFGVDSVEPALGGGSIAEQPGGEPRIVEARDPRHDEGDDQRPPRNRLV